MILKYYFEIEIINLLIKIIRNIIGKKKKYRIQFFFVSFIVITYCH